MHSQAGAWERGKAGIRIVSRAIEDASNEDNKEVFRLFSEGLALLPSSSQKRESRGGDGLANT